MTSPSSTRRLLVCLSNDDFPASLEPRKIYVSLQDDEAVAAGMVRVVDESGEDYLYPARIFAEIFLPSDIEKALGVAG
jgi:hypothetical protein